MSLSLENNTLGCFPMETYFRETGIHRMTLLDGTNIVGVSGNTWEEYCLFLGSVSARDKIIVSPELITYAGESFAELIKCRDFVERRILQMVDFSKRSPETMFVLGTPLFWEIEKPRNSALLIKNGEIVGVTSKRSGATKEEREYFELVAEEPPLLIPCTSTALLICADLPTASLFTNPDANLERSLELYGREHMIGKKVQMLPPTATSLVVMSCWGVGGAWVKEGNADEYYRYQLRNIAWRLMRETNIKEVVMVDRVPVNMPEEFAGITPDKPYNGIIKMV